MEEGYKTLIVVYSFNKESNKLSVSSVCIGEFDSEKSNYKIISGDFKGFTTTDFNEFIIVGNDNPFEMDREKLEKSKITPKIEFTNMENKGNEIIYCFNHHYVNEYAKKHNLSFDIACLSLSLLAYHNTITFPDNFGTLDLKSLQNYMLVTNSDDVNKNSIISMLDYLSEEHLEEKKDIFDKDNIKDSVNEIIEEIRKKIVGQDEAIVTLVTNIFYNQLLIQELCSSYEIDHAELDSRKVGILLDGSTGTGKTAILKDIASRLDLPICFSNANSFSETGYVGPSITDILRKLYLISGRDEKKAEKGIVVLDEIDKIASTASGDGIDMKKGVQEELLGFISGGEYEFPLEDKFGSPTIHFDTSKLTFILSGAFTHLRERKINENKKNGIGFGYLNNERKDNTYTITAQDYVDEGLHREFFGRIKVLTCTKTYSFDDLKTILLTSTISPLKNLERTVRMFGYPGIVYDEEFINDVCTQAIEMQTGARSLQTIMSGIQNRLLMGLISQSYDMDKPIELSINLLNEYNKSLVRRY